MKKVAFLLIVGTALLGVTGASAQINATVTARVQVPQVLRIEVAEPVMDFGTLAELDFASTETTATQSNSVRTLGNIQYDIELSAATVNFLMDGVEGTKPAADLAWSVGGSVEARMTTSATPMVEGVRGRVDTVVSYTLTSDIDDAPGIHDLQIVYTILPAN